MEYKGVLVLCFHRISDEYSPSYPPIPTKVFDQICFFISRNFHVIHPNEILKKKITSKQSVLITFDDAFLDFKINALPILEKYNLPVLQHIITDCADTGDTFWTQRLNKIIEAYYFEKKNFSIPEIGFNSVFNNFQNLEKTSLKILKELLLIEKKKRNEIIFNLEIKLKNKIKHTPMLVWDDIKVINKNKNVVFGSHTKTHENLILLDEMEITKELILSKKKFESNLGEVDELFLAYPNGQYNDLICDIAKKLNYTTAFTTVSAKYNDQSVFQIPRVLVYHKTWLKNFVYLNYMNFKL
jgi:peptidoglycan/xylan/chitin deacetylase (PgdA/CDA1 family)